MITFIEAFKQELRDEALQTKKMLALLPSDNLDYKPHEKSMVMRTLATHLAEIPDMITNGLTEPFWDIAASPWEPAKLNTAAEYVAHFEASIAKAMAALENTKDDNLLEEWQLKAGDAVYLSLKRWETFRHAMGQNAHHRAQLQVYLRLLNIPIPGPYGPSADETDGSYQG